MNSLQQKTYSELTGNILPFWANRARDDKNGGYISEMDLQGAAHLNADKPLILHARILWSFSRAYLNFHNEEYLFQAHRAYKYIISHFLDEQAKGFYSQISYDHLCHQDHKSIVAQAYVIYAFSTYYQASKNTNALNVATQLMQLIESHGKDQTTSLYHSDLTKHWQPFDDIQAHPTTTTYLHLLEAYSELLACEKNETLTNQLKMLLTFFIDNLVDMESGHVKQYRTVDCRNHGFLYGHDLEAAQLIMLACKQLNDELLTERCANVALILIEGVLSVHNNPYEGISWGHNLDKILKSYAEKARVAWVQAEAINALSWAYEYTENNYYAKWLVGLWTYIEEYIVDVNQGEWFEARNENRTLVSHTLKIGEWKCPYHGVRGCIRFNELLQSTTANHLLSQYYHHKKNNREAG